MKRIFALLLALPLLVVACNNEENPTPEPKEPKLELISDELMEFDAIGGTGTISYKLEVEDDANDNFEMSAFTSKVSSSANVEWITISSEQSLPGSLSFDVAANESNEERSGEITVSFNSDSFNVTVKQAAAKDDNGDDEGNDDGNDDGKDEPVGVKGWAVVGSMTNNWDVASAIAMEKIEGYYAARGVEISATDSFKFILDGSMQNCLCGNGQSAERDHKYPTQKYGSDIRVKEAGKYDLYINEALTAYYVMSEGKNPTEAQEVVEPGKDVWYISGLGEEIRMREVGIFLTASNVTLNAEGFKIRNSLTGNYGVATDSEAEIGDEINIVAEAEHNIKVKFDANKRYDIYVKADELKVWVVEIGDNPNYLYESTACEGAWFDSGKNFYLHLTGSGATITLDCTLSEGVKDYIIPETKFVVAFGDDRKGVNYIASEGSQIAHMDGKTSVISGEVTVKHVDGKYDISVDIVNQMQHRVRAHYRGDFTKGMIGSAIINPKN